ncbi:MAG TPA: FHA domain-containing protein [Myxococcota bacterium]|nr:FHA domain-containing protein [Myxococcota bacterium]
MIVEPSLVLGTHPAIVGRDRQCDVALDDESVAEHHVCAWAEGDQVIVASLGSGVPIELDGRAVVGRASALSGSWLLLGNAPPFRLVASALSDAPVRLSLRNAPQLWVRFDHSRQTPRLTLQLGRTADIAFVLAARLAWDGTLRLGADAGWLDDQDLADQLWGKGRCAEGSLNVAVHRLRGELEEHGFARDLVQKAQGRTRLRPDRVGVHAALLR